MAPNKKKETSPERRSRERRTFSHYMRLMNENTGELVGHLVNISPQGLRLESLRSIPLNTDFPLRIELPSDITDKPYMVFIARSRWCRPDRIDPSLFDVGFEIMDMTPGDAEIFKVLFERYGSQEGQHQDRADYLWGR
jgi:PilZ domain-containing protein